MRILVALVVALVLASPGGSTTNDVVSFEPRFGDQGHHIVDPVDYLTWCGDCFDVDYHAGTPWVVNPTSCSWDSDDYFSYVSRGSVAPEGWSSSVSECVYTGPNAPYRFLGIFLSSTSPNLRVMANWTWPGGSVRTQTIPVYDKAQRLWAYVDCLEMPRPQANTDGIPGSNGGQAFEMNVTVRVENLGRKAGKTGGVISSNYSQGEIQRMGCLSFRVP